MTRSGDEAWIAQGRPRRAAGGGEPRSRLVRRWRPSRADSSGRARRLGAGRAAAGAARHRPRTWGDPARPLPRAPGRCAAATRLSVGGRLGLCEPCRAGPKGARRRDARELLDRPAHVPGRLGRDARAPRPDPARRRSLGLRPRGGDRNRHRRRAARRFARGRARSHQIDRAGQRRQLAQPDPGRARQGLRLPPVQAGFGAVARLRRLRTSSARPGARASSMASSRSISTASRSDAPMPART